MDEGVNQAVLALSGLDPCAGAGIVADIEVINHFSLTPLSIITTLTVQNTATVKAVQAVDADLIVAQFNHLQDDIDFKVVKIGLLSSAAQIKAIARLAFDKTIVLDPIIKSSVGNGLLSADLVDVLVSELLPIAKIITPNVAELRALSNEMNEQKAVEKLGCEWILLTTTDDCEGQIEHRLYHQSQCIKRFHYAKLSGSYHGSGCTLSSAISALLALDMEVERACEQALDYTYQTLLQAKKVGKIQYHPNRHPSL